MSPTTYCWKSRSLGLTAASALKLLGVQDELFTSEALGLLKTRLPLSCVVSLALSQGNDAPQVSRHFADAPELSFLWVPPTALPGLQRFLEAEDVPYLSASYSSALINPDDGELDEALTSMVRQFALYFAQILHARDHDAFEEAQESGALKALKSLEVVS